MHTPRAAHVAVSQPLGAQLVASQVTHPLAASAAGSAGSQRAVVPPVHRVSSGVHRQLPVTHRSVVHAT